MGSEIPASQLTSGSVKDTDSEFTNPPEALAYVRGYYERVSVDNVLLWANERTELQEEEIHTQPSEWLANTLLLGKIVAGLKRKGIYQPPEWLKRDIENALPLEIAGNSVDVSVFADTLYRGVNALDTKDQIEIGKLLYLGLVQDYRVPVDSLQAEVHGRAGDTQYRSYKAFDDDASALGMASLGLEETRLVEDKTIRAAGAFMDVHALAVYNMSALAVSVGFRDINDLHEVLFSHDVKHIRNLAGRIRPFGQKHLMPLLRRMYHAYRTNKGKVPEFDTLTYFQKLALTSPDKLIPAPDAKIPYLASDEAKEPLRALVEDLAQKSGCIPSEKIREFMAGIDVAMGEKPVVFPKIIEGILTQKVITVPTINGLWELLEEIGHAIDYYTNFAKTGTLLVDYGQSERTAGDIQRQLTVHLTKAIHTHLPQIGVLPEDYLDRHVEVVKRKRAFFLVHKAAQVEIEARLYEQLGELARKQHGKLIHVHESNTHLRLIGSVRRLARSINRKVNRPVFSLRKKDSVYDRAIQFIALQNPDWRSAGYLLSMIREFLPDADVAHTDLMPRLEQAFINVVKN